MFGPDQPVILHLLDIEPAAKALEGVRMELIDAALPLLAGVVTTTDPAVAAKGVDVAVMVGGFPRKAGMERKDVMAKNVAIYASQAAALQDHAAKGVKVLVVANPANTNALILSQHAPGIPRSDITCLTRLDHNRAAGAVAERLGVPVATVKNVIIWGNHSSTQVRGAVVCCGVWREMLRKQPLSSGSRHTLTRHTLTRSLSPPPLSLCVSVPGRRARDRGRGAHPRSHRGRCLAGR
jgi:malate dehydrogenase